MNADQNRAKSIFLTAAEISSSAEREAYLAAQCGGDEPLRREVEDLLQHHAQAQAFLESPAANLPSPPWDRDEVGSPRPPWGRGAGGEGVGPTTDDPITERPGTVIGPYKLLQQIGEGGMGTVFMAEQEHPVRRKVALKVIKPGMDSRQVVARFEAERQALALMDHPNIAKVLGGGATEGGRPFFVMEYVEGVPITQHCDDARLSI